MATLSVSLMVTVNVIVIIPLENTRPRRLAAIKCHTYDDTECHILGGAGYPKVCEDVNVLATLSVTVMMTVNDNIMMYRWNMCQFRNVAIKCLTLEHTECHYYVAQHVNMDENEDTYT